MSPVSSGARRAVPSHSGTFLGLSPWWCWRSSRRCQSRLLQMPVRLARCRQEWSHSQRVRGAARSVPEKRTRCSQLTRQVLRSCLHPETALISTSCTCQSAQSGRRSFWSAWRCTCVLTALWQLASEKKTQRRNLTMNINKLLFPVTLNAVWIIELTKLGSLFKQASTNSFSGLL